MASTTRGTLGILLVVCLVYSPLGVSGIYLQGTDTSYARFPKWDACVNASLSFEFKATRGQRDALLLYTDDGGRYDFFMVSMIGGRVRLELNVVDGRDGQIRLEAGRDVHDGRWHKVEIRRKRMETSLIVDTLPPVSKFAFGSDFNFGEIEKNSDVFFGGLPTIYNQDLHALALPSVLFQPPRFKGSLRNIIYGNCTCQRKRAGYIDGEGVSLRQQEACDARNPCRSGCLCVSTDQGAECDCSELQCVTGAVTHYHLPMDRMFGNVLDNPSGLDASAIGDPEQLRRGIENNAIRLKAPNQYLKATGPGHRYECFGDLDLCALGYTMSFWMNFENPAEGETVYLSNGGHASDNHGVALIYNNGNMEFRFRKKDGTEWRVKSNDVLPGRWYHVAATWGPNEGASLYVNGNLVDSTLSPVTGRSADPDNEYNNLLIGRPNDNSQLGNTGSILVDEMHFWSMFKTAMEIRELGPFFRYHFPMDILRGGEFADTSIRHNIQGNPTMVEGKIGKAVKLDGRRDYIDLGDHSDTCLGNLELCLYGITTVMWVKFDDLLENSYFLSSGNKGFKLFYRNGKLVADFQKGDSYWEVSWDNPQRGKWYFLELSWHPTDGLRMFVNQDQVAHASTYNARQQTEGNSNLYVGRANTNMFRERYGSATIDELEFWYGDRNRLILFDFLQRGKPTKFLFNMDAISDSGVQLVHPDMVLSLHGKPQLVEGKIGPALELNGNGKYANLGHHNDTCLGNLDLCHHGLLLATWFKPGEMSQRAEIMSSGVNGLKVWYDNGQLKASFRTTTREWNLSYGGLPAGFWYFLEFSWDPARGLSMYINNQLAAHTIRAEVRTHSGEQVSEEKDTFYVGRGENTRRRSFGNITIDEFEYWYGNREYLLAHGYIQRGKPDRYYFDMNAIEGNRLVHPDLVIPVHGNPTNVPGKLNQAIRLDGRGQYIDIGEHLDTCLGNLEYCRHGFTGSMWANFKRFEQNAYLMSTGRKGINIFYKDNSLHVTFELGDQKWEVPLPSLATNKWYFLEYSWHPETGLKVYVNNQLVGSSSARTVPDQPGTGGRDHVFLGRANQGVESGNRFKYMDAIVDEMETWFGRREELIAFNYILRDKIPHISIPFEASEGNIVSHPDFRIVLHDRARLASGKIGNGVSLDGSRDYVTFGDQRDKCLGNLEKCAQGLTMSFYTYPRSLRDDTYFVSSGPYQVYYKDGQLVVEFSTATKTWRVSSPQFDRNKWQKVDVSWAEDGGLQLYLDNEKVSSTTEYVTHPARQPTDNYVYIGRPNGERDGNYANAVIDELQYWYAPRDVLVSLGLIDTDIRREIFTMDEIRGDKLIHPGRTVYVYGYPRNVPGPNGNAVLLDGNRQYIDAGSNLTCSGDLENCGNGFTLRFKIKPNELRENMYFVSSAPVDVYYKNRKLVSEVRTPNRKWIVSSPSLDTQAWHQVDLSWDPVNGLMMYIDSNRVSHTVSSVTNTDIYNYEDKFLIGRSNRDMTDKYYANTIIDDVEIWQAKRDILIGLGLLDETGEPIPTWGPPVVTDSPVTPRPWTPGPNEMLVFNGRNWITYDFSQLPPQYLVDNDYEQFLIQFRTNNPDGLIWYSGTKERNMHLNIKQGWLELAVDYGDGRVRKFRVSGPNGIRLDNGQWHDVRIVRDGRRITIDVDGVSSDPFTVDSGSSFITDGYVVVGGYKDAATITENNVRQSFDGSIRKLLLQGDNTDDINLLNLYNRSPRPSYVVLNGLVDEDEKLTGLAFNGRNWITYNFGQLPPQYQGDSDYEQLLIQFQTKNPNGLIWYSGTDDRNMHLNIKQGWLELAVDYGDGRVRKFRVSGPNGIRLDNGEWHDIRMIRNGRRITIDVDGVSSDPFNVDSGTSFITDGYVVVGGYKDAATITGNNVRESFDGSIRKLILQGDSIDDINLLNLYNQSPRPSYVVLNGLIDRDVGPGLTFNGRNWITYDFSQLPPEYLVDNSYEQLLLQLKTNYPSGLIWFSGDLDKNMHLSMKNGYLLLVVDYGNGRVKKFRVSGPNGVRLDDNKWHDIRVIRDGRTVYIDVDGVSSDPFTVDDNFMITDGYVVLGGYDNAGKLSANNVQHSFQGSIRKVVMKGDRISDINLLDLYNRSPRPSYVVLNGLIGPRPGGANGVAFRRPEAFLTLNKWQGRHSGIIDFKFRTVEPHNLILYNGGKLGFNDFVAVEMFDGILYFVVNFGEGVLRYAFTELALNDGQSHHVIINRNRRTLTLTIDGDERSYDIPGRDHTLDLGTFLYIGGVNDPRILPWQLWTRNPKFFVGCLWDLTINGGEILDLATIARDQVKVDVSPGCVDMPVNCAARPCVHGICTDKWSGYSCDCAGTAYSGKRCHLDAKLVAFDGSSFINIRLTPMMSTHTNDISLRFKTAKSDGLLFSTANQYSSEYMKAMMADGRVKVQTNLGREIKSVMVGSELDDNEWHTLHIKRRANYLEVWVDDGEPVISDIPGEGYTLDVDEVTVAAMGSSSSRRDSFVGVMQNFLFDKHDFFSYLDESRPGIKINNTGTIPTTDEPDLPVNKITFRSRTGAYVTLPRFIIGDRTDISFMFKTTEPNGLMLYQDGRGDDFFAMELVRGNIHVILNDGFQEKIVAANGPGALNDNEWHSVKLKRTSAGNLRITVDKDDTQIPSSDFDRFDFHGNLYVGGIQNYEGLPQGIYSQHGYQGCMASVRINKQLYNIKTDALSTTDLVTEGCTDSSINKFCLPDVDVCQNYGICKEGWNSYWCDCNMTAYVGRMCTAEPEGYLYGHDWSKAVVVYEYDEPIETNRDELAVGFMTNYPNGTIMRVDSGDSNDYIIASLVNGYVNLTYYMGKIPYTLMETRRNFSDGNYHVIRFIREGADGTMWVDSYPPHEVRTRETAVHLFNEQKIIKVGGNIDEENRIFNYFDGITAGVYLNGIRVIDRALVEDYHVTVYGEDYRYADHPFRLTKGPRPSTEAPIVTEGPIIPDTEPPGPSGGPDTPKPPVVVTTPIIIPEVPAEVPAGYPGGGVAWGTITGGGDGGGGTGGGGGGGTGGGGGGGTGGGGGGGTGGGGGGGTGGGGGGTGGGGGGGDGAGGGGGAGGGDGEIVRVDPGGGGGGGGVPPGAQPIGPGGSGSTGGLQTGPVVGAGAAEGGRAMAVAGTLLGVMLLGSSLMWALYKFKPGLISVGGGGGGGGGGATLNISAPKSAATNYSLVKSAGGGPGMGMGSGAGSGTGTGTAIGSGYSASTVTKAEVNGAASTGVGAGAGYGAGYSTATMKSSAGTQTMDGAGVGAGAGAGAGAGGSSAAFAEYFSSVTHAGGGGGAGGYGTMSRGMQTEVAPAPPAPAAYTDLSQSAQSRTQMYESSQTSGTTAGGGTINQSSAMASEIVHGGHGGDAAQGTSMSSYKESKSYASSMETYNAAGSYQMQNMALNMGNAANAAALAAGNTPNLMAAEEIRVDCVLMSSDGRYVVTGSIYGPPQIWDMTTGNLVKITSGEDFSSTDLHLACNDTLLVGQVAEMTQVDPNDTLATSRVHHRKLQIWDFESGRPLEMTRNELCTASCMMNDGERIVLGRTEKFGGGTTIVIWDIPGNEAVRKLHYDGSVGFADYISYLNLSRDNRYVVAGFQNSYDGNANFIIFDLTRDNYNVIEPKILALDAMAECSAILANHEAVTGTRKGELTIWSMRTGKPLRQLVGPTDQSTLSRMGSTSTMAHAREVKALAISEDGKTLVSASSDGTLKVWDLDTEKQKFTIKGHTDEVLCCALSQDGQTLVSGSKDNTIRLWRMSNGSLICAYNCGVDIFSVKISNNKKTIVALGDRYGARKLIMLQIVVTKTKSRNPSRATSPQGRPITPR